MVWARVEKSSTKFTCLSGGKALKISSRMSTFTANFLNKTFSRISIEAKKKVRNKAIKTFLSIFNKGICIVVVVVVAESSEYKGAMIQQKKPSGLHEEVEGSINKIYRFS